MDLVSVKWIVLVLCLSGCCSAQDALPDGPVEAVVGSNVTLKTLLKEAVYDVILWNFSDGKDSINVVTLRASGPKVSERFAGRVSVDKATGALTLGPLKVEDGGDYSISAVGDATWTGETKLRVLEPVSDVIIKSDPLEAIEPNTTVILTCTAKGSVAKFTWINGTAPIMADGKRVTQKDVETSSSLTIRNVLRWDLMGPIYCSAANTLETKKSAPFNLTVFYGPEEVTITPPKPNPFIESGSNFTLTCSAQSHPPATFNWYHNQTQMKFSGPILSLKVIEGEGYGKQAADYTCKASNTKTNRMVPSPAVSFTTMEAVSGANVVGPTSTLIAGNSSANLSCSATAGTVKTTTWLKDDQPLSAGPRVVFSSDMSSVLINPLQKEDNGNYMCHLGNPINTVTAVYRMVVNYGPDSATVKGPEAVEVGDLIEITCMAESVPPANITWKFNGTMLNEKSTKYTIEKAEYQNSGTYTCEMHNTITGKMATKSHFLSVKAHGALDEGLSDGAIAGIVIAVLVAVGAAIGLFFYCQGKVPVTESPY
ncbi:carcinoembryonic antigen-related cell adhesion molecule 2-like isoform X2 [Mugil cephalus]|uniref:carcinoembryonic antigen-related cell adhesion molecule 2-like isoform X2 n=1 Tax=Mugil cephalus TaxID=48193 RepID=UPI001FB58F36|nr:carcinoembryonic antigen-related cell adhesion molecule 2-like isoform X2 [Mugil cephalus]